MKLNQINEFKHIGEIGECKFNKLGWINDIQIWDFYEQNWEHGYIFIIWMMLGQYKWNF